MKKPAKNPGDKKTVQVSIMAGEGFAKDAQRSTERNRNQLRSIGFDRMKHNQFINAPEVSYKEATPEELAALRREYAARKQKELRFQVIIYSVTFLLFVSITIWILT